MKDYDFKVSREPLLREDGVDSGYDALFDADTREQLSVVSRDYQLITHVDAINSYHKVFKSMGETVEHYRFSTTNRGKKFRGEFKLSDHEFDINGDHYIPTLITENSIDRTRSFISRFGLYRIICENGAIVSLKETQNLRIPHFQDNIDMTAIGEGIKHGIDVLKSSFRDKFTELNAERFGKSDLNNFLTAGDFPVAFKIEIAQYMIDNNLARFESERTSNLIKPVSVIDMDQITQYVWWNILTQVATHRIHSVAKRAQIDSTISRSLGV